MKTSRQAGALNLLLIPLILVSVVTVGVAAFAYTSYGQAQDYKNNVDAKISVAVDEAEKKVSEQKDKDFAEKEKYPYSSYTGPEAAGSVRILYPKTWSAYAVEADRNASKPLDAYFQPQHVPNISDQNNSYALRIMVSQQSYDTILKQYASKQKQGKVAVQPYQSPNVPNVIGAKVEGEVQTNKQGTMIVMPFRDKTLQMWTESANYRNDFNNIILKNFTFTP